MTGGSDKFIRLWDFELEEVILGQSSWCTARIVHSHFVEAGAESDDEQNADDDDADKQHKKKKKKKTKSKKPPQQIVQRRLGAVQAQQLELSDEVLASRFSHDG